MNILYLTFFIAAICFIFAVARIIYGLFAMKNIPNFLRYAHLILYSMVLIIFALIPYTIGYKIKYQGELMALVSIVEIFSFICCCYSSLKLDEFVVWREKNKNAMQFSFITAKDVANKFGLEYLETIPDTLYNLDENGGMYYNIEKRRYLEFLPLNTIQSYQPITWQDNYMKYDEYSSFESVISNTNNFQGIENLSSILLKMVKMYQQVLTEDIFLSCYDFALKLSMDARPRYRGKAELVILKRTVLNEKISLKERQETRKKCISEFLNCFLGYNFGDFIYSNDELKKEVDRLYFEAKRRQLIIWLPRRDVCVQNRDVKKYNYGGIRL